MVAVLPDLSWLPQVCCRHTHQRTSGPRPSPAAPLASLLEVGSPGQAAGTGSSEDAHSSKPRLFHGWGLSPWGQQPAERWASLQAWPSPKLANWCPFILPATGNI